MLLTLISGWASHSSVTLHPHKLMPSALSPFVFSLKLFLLRRCPVLHCSDMAQHNYTVKGTSCSLQEKPVDTESSISSSISSHCGVHYRKQLKPSSSASNIQSYLHIYHHLKHLMMWSKVSIYNRQYHPILTEGKKEENLYSVRLLSDPDSSPNIQSSFTNADGTHILSQNFLTVTLWQYTRIYTHKESKDLPAQGCSGKLGWINWDWEMSQITMWLVSQRQCLVHQRFR